MKFPAGLYESVVGIHLKYKMKVTGGFFTEECLFIKRLQVGKFLLRRKGGFEQQKCQEGQIEN